MLSNYLKIAFRNLVKTRQFSVINILGLAIGMSICLIILSYVSFEKSYDRFHGNANRIYRLRYERYSEDGESVRFASCCPPVGLRIRPSLPEVEKVARIFRRPASVSHGENRFIEERLYFAEQEFFEIFDFKFIEGDRLRGISTPNTALISQSTARKYFGDQNPIGKSIRVDKTSEFQVNGVFEDIPGNSHLKFDIVLPWSNLLDIIGKDYEDSWGDSGAYTYLLFKEEADRDAFQGKLDAIADKEFGEALRHYKLTMKLPLQPLTDIHLTSHFQQEHELNGDKQTVNLLFIVAIFIIIIAWVNYINLSTARSLTRAREVGLRKVVGASRLQLAMQFFLEVIIINVIAMVLSLVLVETVQPLFSGITGTIIDHNILSRSWLWLAVLVMFIAGMFLSGLYPIVVLTSYRPIQVLKGKLGNKPKGLNLRKALVVFQFTMAIGLITCTFAVFRQISFLKKQELGFNIDQVFIVRAPRVRDANFRSNLNAFKQEVLKSSSVTNMCVLTETPGRQIYWDAGGIHPVGSDVSKNYQIVGVDYDFVNLFRTQIIEGRNFSKDFPSDSVALILNETAVKWMGFPDPKAAIGQRVDYWGIIYTIVGVMKDYHQQSPKAAFEPHIYRLLPYGRGIRGLFAFKLNSSDPQSTIKNIQKQYDNFFPDNPFEYFFLDEYFNQQYKADLVVGKAFGVFSFLAVFVTALGILGLFSFMVIQRTKEISIRNVLGSGTTRILILFGKDFMALIFIAFFITVPICYYGIKVWLESFASRMQMGVTIFVLPLLIMLVVSGLTIWFQVMKAAMANPADNLRYE